MNYLDMYIPTSTLRTQDLEEIWVIPEGLGPIK